MAIFYSVVEGDPLDSGGTGRVMEGSPNCTIQGDDGRVRNQTFLGQKAWCDACKSSPAEGGMTDDTGQTHLLATVASEEEIHIYLGSEA